MSLSLQRPDRRAFGGPLRLQDLASQDPVIEMECPARLVASGLMGTLLTKRRAVDLCRVAACLCRRP